MTEKVKKDAKDLNNRRVLLITAILALIVMLTYTISLFVGGMKGIHAGGGTVAHHGHRRCGTGKLLVANTGQQQEMLKAPQSMRSFFLTFGSMHSIISNTNHTNYTEMII